MCFRKQVNYFVVGVYQEEEAGWWLTIYKWAVWLKMATTSQADGSQQVNTISDYSMMEYINRWMFVTC